MDKLHFDPLDIQLDDLDRFEAMTGQEFDAVDWEKPGSSRKLAKGIYFLVMRQNDPAFTLDSLAGVTIREVGAVVQALADMAPNPTKGADAP